MALKPPTKYPAAVRKTLSHLVSDAAVRDPLATTGEARYILTHARRLHDSFGQLPPAQGNGRCLVIGSWGLEVPILCGDLGYSDVTCLCAPRDLAGVLQRQTRRHPNEDREFEFTLLEHDVESGPMPFEDESFDLVVFWGCFEHLRNDPEYALFEVNRVCAPGAVISLVTDNAISFQATHSVLRGSPMPMRLHDPASEGHWRLYTPMEIAELLRGTGWRVDLLTSIVPDPPVYWRWWKRALFKKVVADLRRGFGMAEPFWNAFILVHATKSAQPTRAYPSWLYKDEKIRELKLHMMEMLEDQASLSRSA